ncbi:MAG: hypothetical protein V7711_18735 [Pseudomonadales bacterium]
MSSDHIAYAMRNAEATEKFISFNAPSQLLDWSFIAIELILLVGIICAIVHAFRHAKLTGGKSALLTLLAAFYYGVLMDMFGYYGPESFWHGEFSVMFLYNRLPLYIALFYPAFMYHVYMTIRRYNFSPIVEALSVGFYSGLTYQIFDNLGPQLGWWIWDPNEITNQPFLSSVPVTSYQWFFTFEAAFALVTRYVCWEWPAKGYSTGKIVAGMIAVPFLTFIVGTLIFVPYQTLVQFGQVGLAAATHALLFSAFGLVFLFNWRRPLMKRDKLLMIFPLTFVVGLMYIYIAKVDQFYGATDGLNAEGWPVGNLIAVILGMVGSLAILLKTHPVEDAPAVAES